jgi:hypothetical protein
MSPWLPFMPENTQAEVGRKLAEAIEELFLFVVLKGPDCLQNQIMWRYYSSRLLDAWRFPVADGCACSATGCPSRTIARSSGLVVRPTRPLIVLRMLNASAVLGLTFIITVNRTNPIDGCILRVSVRHVVLVTCLHGCIVAATATTIISSAQL